VVIKPLILKIFQGKTKLYTDLTVQTVLYFANFAAQCSLGGEGTTNRWQAFC
jgi:hypothetical protein